MSAEQSTSPDDLLTVGEVAERTGAPASALRFYEALGLITAERSPGRQRRYRRHMLRRISLVLAAKRLGIPLTDVAAILTTLPAGRTPSQHDWHHVSQLWKGELEARRRYLGNLERELTGCIGCGCLSMRSCGVRNPGDQLARHGQGPVRLEDDIEPDPRTAQVARRE
ncbi:redox-sensitive transcriptional activator SoxR [Actinoplanes subglobosus]|uniref:Redox-sensitive transcriptional activator SoxR n=1 Tax=Actinoplanes subglobosus TaxID=1547892 RepID=A0ABV8IH54_9ACTN